MPQYEYLDENDNPIPEDVALSGAFNVVDDQPDVIPEIRSSEPDTGFFSGFKRALQANLEDPLSSILPGHVPSYDALNQDLTYNPDQPTKPKTMADILHTAVNAGGDEITSGISGLLSRAENNINPILGTDSQMGEALRQETLPYRQDRNATLDSVSPTSGLGIASNLVRSGVGMSPALLPGVGLLGSAGIMGLQTAGNKYTQMRDQGVSPENAASASNVAGLGTGVTSLLPLGVLKKEAGPILKTIESMAAGAGFGEMNVPLDTYANYVGTGEAPTYDEMVSQIPRAAGMGAALGGILGAAHGIAGRRAKGPEIDLEALKENVPIGGENLPSVLPFEPPAVEPQKIEPQIPAPLDAKEAPIPEPLTPPESQSVPPSRPKPPIDLTKMEGEQTFVDVKKEIAKQEPATPQSTPVDFNLEVKNVPTQEVPIHEIQLSQDVPNFKKGANKEGVVDPLNGKYERLGTPPIVVWERLDGRKEVITGRHRLDLARRTGETTIPSQIVREADGFTKRMAQRLDAESNIRDEKGTVSDYALYFKHSGISRGEAEARGLLSRSKGTQGFAIGTSAVPEVYALHSNGKISDATAAAIADAAPNDATFQRAGLKYASQGLPPDAIYNAIKILQTEPRSQSSADQGDLFGADDSGMLRAAQEGKVLAQMQKDVALDIKSTQNAAKLSDRAKKGGVTVDDPKAVLARNESLKAEQEKLAKGYLFPEVMAEVRARLKSNKGAITTEPLTAAIDKVGDLAEGVKRWARGEDADFEAISEVQKYLSGGRWRFVPGGKIPKEVTSTIRKNFSYLSTIAAKDSRAAKAMEISREFPMDRHRVLSDATDKLQPYFTLPDASRSKVDEFLLKTRLDALAEARKGGGRRLPKIQDEVFLKAKWTPEEIAGYRSVRDAMDYGLEVQRQALLADADKIQDPMAAAGYMADVDEFIDKQIDMHYVPLSRFGKKAAVIGHDKEGNVIFREHFDSYGQAKRAKARLEAKGVKAVATEILQGDFNPHSGLPPEMLPEAGVFNADKWNEYARQGKPVRGYAQHLIRAQGIEGFSGDVRRNLNEYFLGLSSFYANKKLQPRLKEMFSQIDPKKDPALNERLKAHFDALQDPKTPAGMIVRLANGMYLAGVPLLVPVQMAQSVAITIPAAIKELGGGWSVGATGKGYYHFGKGMKQAADYLTDGIKPGSLKFKNRNPELHAALQVAERDGILGSSLTNEFAGYVKRPDGKTPLDQKAMIFMSAGEKMQRVTSYITGYNIARSKGLAPETAMKFGQDFMYKTVPDPTKVDRPLMANSLVGKTAFLYKNYIGFNIRFLRNLATPQEFPLLLHSLGLMMAAGGAFAFPGGRETKKVLESFGYDPNTAIRENFPGLADQMLYGWLAPYINISSSVSTQEFLPNVDKDPLKAAGSALLGPAGDLLLNKPIKAISLAREGEYGQAAKAMAPRAIRNLAKAYEMATTGKLTDAGGFVSVPNATAGDVARMVIGAPPLQQSKSYEAKNTAYELSNRVANQTKRINDRFNKAVQSNDMIEAGKVLEEAAAQGITPRVRPPKLDNTFDQIIKTAPPGARQELMRLKGIYEQ